MLGDKLVGVKILLITETVSKEAMNGKYKYFSMFILEWFLWYPKYILSV